MDSLNSQRDTRPIGQRCTIARRHIRDRTGQAVADVVISVGNGRVRSGFQRQLALVVVGIVRDPRSIGDAAPLAIGPELVVVGRDDRVVAIDAHDVGQATQQIVAVADRRAARSGHADLIAQNVVVVVWAWISI